MLALVYFGLNTVSYGVSLWLPALIRSLSGASNFAVGMLSAIPYVVAAVAMVAVGLHSDRSGERRWHTALPAFTGGFGADRRGIFEFSGPGDSRHQPRCWACSP